MFENIDAPDASPTDLLTECERFAATSREYVSSFRALLIEIGERHKLPQRFEVYPCSDKVAMKIVDTETGRSAEVVLSAYGDVRKVLTQLFEPPPSGVLGGAILTECPSDKPGLVPVRLSAVLKRICSPISRFFTEHNVIYID